MSISLEQRELNRRRYLDAMGIATYVSRRQLAGAAPTRRLAMAVPEPLLAPPASPAGHAPPGSQEAAPPLSALVGKAAKPLESQSPAGPATQDGSPGRSRPATGLRFSLAVIFTGGVAWLEDLGGRPLATEQVQLVQAMARALGPGEGKPDTMQFDWPPHRNSQLDIGPDAARAALAGYLGRQLDQRRCRGLVLLGEGQLAQLAPDSLADVTVVRTRSTLAMLADSSVKRQVWRDLQPLVLRA